MRWDCDPGGSTGIRGGVLSGMARLPLRVLLILLVCNLLHLGHDRAAAADIRQDAAAGGFLAPEKPQELKFFRPDRDFRSRETTAQAAPPPAGLDPAILPQMRPPLARRDALVVVSRALPVASSGVAGPPLGPRAPPV
jgi:hypothetical protein